MSTHATAEARASRRLSKKNSRTPRRRREAPAGLVAAFTMINRDNSTPIAAPETAAQVYPYALQILDLLHGRIDVDEEQDVAIGKALERATVERHGDCFDAAQENPELVGETVFYVGFAACWLLMTAVNGKDGAR